MSTLVADPGSGTRSFEGRLEMEFSARAPDGISYLNRGFRSGQFHFSKPYWDGSQLAVQVVNPTAGIFENDRLFSRLVFNARSRVCVFSPSSNQVYAMEGGGEATACQQLSIAEGAAAVVIPKWTVLHRGARFSQTTSIRSSPGGSFLYADLIAAGRVANGEFLRFHEFQSTTEVYINDRLLLKDRLDCGANRKQWVWYCRGEAFGFLATLYLQFPSAAQVIEQVFPALADMARPETQCGISALTPDFVALRIAGKSNRAISSLLKALLQQIGDHLPVSDVYRRMS